MSWVVTLGDRSVALEALPELSTLPVESLEGGVWQLELDGRPVAVVVEAGEDGLVLWWRGRPYAVRVEPQAHFALRERFRAVQADARAGSVVRAHMPGLVTQVRVKEGQPVHKGDGLFVIEAMKMENEIVAPAGGIVQGLRAAEGRQVEKGAELCVIRAEPGP